MYEIGNRIRYLRRLRGYSQQEIADATEVKRSTIAKIERDDQRPPLDFLIRFAEKCNIKIDDLINLDVQEVTQPTMVHESEPTYRTSPGKAFPMIAKLAEASTLAERKTLAEQLTQLVAKILDENAEQKNEIISLLRKLNEQ